MFSFSLYIFFLTGEIFLFRPETRNKEGAIFISFIYLFMYSGTSGRLETESRVCLRASYFQINAGTGGSEDENLEIRELLDSFGEVLELI